MKGKPIIIIDKYSQASAGILPSAPRKKVNPRQKQSQGCEYYRYRPAIIKHVQHYYLQLLFSSPINLAIDAVTPEPNPIVNPSIREK